MEVIGGPGVWFRFSRASAERRPDVGQDQRNGKEGRGNEEDWED